MFTFLPVTVAIGCAWFAPAATYIKHNADLSFMNIHYIVDVRQFATDCNRLQQTGTDLSNITLTCQLWIYIVLLTYARLQQTATDCNRLQQTATDCSTINSEWLYTVHVAASYHCIIDVRQTATDCNRLQQTATDCSTINSEWLYTVPVAASYRI